jgi:hypothetical protein
LLVDWAPLPLPIRRFWALFFVFHRTYPTATQVVTTSLEKAATGGKAAEVASVTPSAPLPADLGLSAFVSEEKTKSDRPELCFDQVDSCSVLGLPVTVLACACNCTLSLTVAMLVMLISVFT